MDYHCKKCRSELLIHGLSSKRKMEVWNLRVQEGPLFAIKSLVDNDDFSLKEAKRVALHLTPEAGRCNRCGDNNLIGFEVVCEACQSLNLNWAPAS